MRVALIQMLTECQYVNRMIMCSPVNCKLALYAQMHVLSPVNCKLLCLFFAVCTKLEQLVTKLNLFSSPFFVQRQRGAGEATIQRVLNVSALQIEVFFYALLFSFPLLYLLELWWLFRRSKFSGHLIFCKIAGTIM